MNNLLLIEKKIKALRTKKTELRFEKTICNSLGFEAEYKRIDDEINQTIGMIDHLEEIRDDIQHFQIQFDEVVDQNDNLEKEIELMCGIIEKANDIPEEIKKMVKETYHELNRT